MYLAGIQFKLAGIAHVQIPWKTHLYRLYADSNMDSLLNIGIINW
jgi:hypothetical protein